MTQTTSIPTDEEVCFRCMCGKKAPCEEHTITYDLSKFHPIDLDELQRLWSMANVRI